jgi:hypothetical protein
VESKRDRIRRVKERWQNLCVIAATIPLSSGSAYPQTPQETKDVGRYVLLNATVLMTVLDSKMAHASREKVPLVLKIDTVTGKTWQLNIGMTNGKPYQHWDLIDEE